MAWFTLFLMMVLAAIEERKSWLISDWMRLFSSRKKTSFSAIRGMMTMVNFNVVCCQEG